MKMAYLQPRHIGGARSGVVEEQQQRPISQAEAATRIGRAQQSFQFRCFEVFGVLPRRYFLARDSADSAAPLRIHALHGKE